MDNTGKLLAVFVVVANAIAVVALILAFVGVARNGTNQYYINSSGVESGSGGDSDGVVINSNDDKIWMLQIGHFGSNTQYLDEASGTIRGYDVDVVNSVCQLAGKNCALVWDLYENCWDSQAGQRARGGDGLMGDWYDACIGWYHTLDRARTYSFSSPIEKGLKPVFFVRRGTSSFSFPNFGGLKIGFLDGWWIDEHCLNRYSVNGLDITDVNQVIHYQTEELAITAINAGEVDVLFMPNVAFLVQHPDLRLAHEPPTDMCASGGPGVMTRKNQFELLTWFNAAFERLVSTSQYQDICDNLSEDHGGQPGPSAEEVCVA